jgi:acyl carrier protein
MPEPTTILPEIIELVRHVAKLDSHVAIDAESRLIEDLGIDSLDLVGIYLSLQDDYGVSIDEEDMTRLPRVGDLAAFVAAQRTATAA